MTWSHRPWSSGRAPNLCHRRIQEAGVLSVIERSGGLFGQVLKMEETPKWHKMTIVNPKKNRNTFFTNLHYLCWDLPFLFFWGWPLRLSGHPYDLATLQVRLVNLGWEKPWENPRIFLIQNMGGSQNGGSPQLEWSGFRCFLGTPILGNLQKGHGATAFFCSLPKCWIPGSWDWVIFGKAWARHTQE